MSDLYPEIGPQDFDPPHPPGQAGLVCQWPASDADLHGGPVAYRVRRHLPAEDRVVCHRHGAAAVQQGWDIEGTVPPAPSVQERAARGDEDAIRRMEILAQLPDSGVTPGDVARLRGLDLDDLADPTVPASEIEWTDPPQGPRQDPIADLGAAGPPPARHLTDFQCGACSLTFKADDDTQICPRCEVVGHLFNPTLTVAMPTEAELRNASASLMLAPMRMRLDALWDDIASNLVTLLLAGRAAVEAYDAGAGQPLNDAITHLATVLGMRPDADGTVPRPAGPHVEMLQETADMMRAEAATLERAGAEIAPGPPARLTGAVRRLRDQANLIIRTVGEPT